jgi:glycosyltransferase involved in cell wall biosynthesis
MEGPKNINVAILLPTYNGGRYIDQQIRSLKENVTPFTLHWLDDHSADDSRQAVYAAVAREGIPLQEWHQPQHLGLPHTFFRLLELVEADIYLFCDQDDIWQPGKIDFTVQSLLRDLGTASLSFSDSLVFYNDRPTVFRRESQVFYRRPYGLQQSRLFMPPCANGHTQGFTRAARDIFLSHNAIAHEHAYMHDVWMYDIAIACGVARLLDDAPTTLYRQHQRNATGDFVDIRGNWISRNWRIFSNWRKYQLMRQLVARHARGFLLAAATMPGGPKLQRALVLAQLVAGLDRRQPLSTLIRLSRYRAWTDWQAGIWYTIMCLCTDATRRDSVAIPNSEAATPKT